MNSPDAQATLNKIIGQIFGYKNPYTLEQFLQKFAFDVRLPVQVNDMTSGETTWAQSVTSGKFITFKNTFKYAQSFEQEKQPINSVEDILKIWEKFNFTSTERYEDCINVAESDSITKCENVFRSLDVHQSKNILFCDGVMQSEYVVGSQRSISLNYCAKVDDSRACSSSFSVNWCNNIVNSLFISDCHDMYECMFCAHTSSKRFCIANMQFEETEYQKIKDMVVRWVLTQ